MWTVKRGSIDDVKNLMPDMLYKFRNWELEKHKTILTKQEIFFSSPYGFTDQFDCRYPINFDMTFERIRPILDYYYPYEKSQVTRRDLDFFLRDHYRKRFGTSAQQQSLIDQWYKDSNDVLGVVSLTTRRDNYAMWGSEYANDFQGFGVGIDFSDCVPELMENHTGGGHVEYVPEDYPKMEFISAALSTHDELVKFHMDLVHRKYETFAFEEEYRLTKRLYQPLYPNGIRVEDRLFQIPKRCFKELLFGCKTPPSYIEEIRTVCQKQGLNVNFFMATHNETKEVVVSPL